LLILINTCSDGIHIATGVLMNNYGGKREGAGRKKKMVTNDFLGWFDELLVRHLNWDGYPVGLQPNWLKKWPSDFPEVWKTHWPADNEEFDEWLKARHHEDTLFTWGLNGGKSELRCWVAGEILISMGELEKAFGRDGVDAFKELLAVLVGNSSRGLSRAGVGTVPARRVQLLEYIELRGLLPRLKDGPFTFVHSVRREKRLQSMSLADRLALREAHGTNWMAHA